MGTSFCGLCKKISDVSAFIFLGCLISVFIYLGLQWLSFQHHINQNLSTLLEPSLKIVGIIAFICFPSAFLFWILSQIKIIDFPLNIKTTNATQHFFTFVIICVFTTLGYFYGKFQGLTEVEKERVKAREAEATIAQLKLQLEEQKPTPTPVKKVINQQPQQQQPIVTNPQDNEEWGVAKQISEHSWRMKIGLDERMTTVQELYIALNNYRKSKGQSELVWDDRLAAFAQARADFFNKAGQTDEHKGFEEFVNNDDNLKNLGFWGVGENSSYGYKLEGVHIIEWMYAGDAPHDNNQLDSSWTHVGVGVTGTETDIIFGKWKM